MTCVGPEIVTAVLVDRVIQFAEACPIVERKHKNASPGFEMVMASELKTMVDSYKSPVRQVSDNNFK